MLKGRQALAESPALLARAAQIHARHRHHRPNVLQLLFGLGLERSQRLLLRGLLFRRRHCIALLALRVLRITYTT